MGRAGLSPSSRRRPLQVWLNPQHGRNLLQLGFELCWATTWMDYANRWIAPVLGLPVVNPRVGLRENDFHTLAASPGP